MRNSLAWIVTLGDIMHDLDTGRGDVTRPRDRMLSLRSRRRPVAGGLQFMATYGVARALSRLHPRLAAPALMRLWRTPWVHPNMRRTVVDLDADLMPWSLRAGRAQLDGYTGGDGPTVVLLHGWAGRAADWRYLAADLITAGWRVVAPDLPAHGATEGRTTDLFELGDAAAAVLHREQPRAIVTHSMGFPIALTAFDTGALQPATLVALAPGRRLHRALERFGEQTRMPTVLLDELRRANQRRFGADVWNVLDVDAHLPGLTCEGIVIHDVEDADVPLADARHIAERWPAAALITTHGLGHRRILRDPLVKRHVVDALRTRSRS